MATAEGYRYPLERYAGPASRYTCPSCGHRRCFTRYVDTATGEHLAEHVGRCDRENNCGHHVKPREYFAEGGERPSAEWTPPPPAPELPGFRMKRDQMERTMGKPCHLLVYLSTEGGLDPEQVEHTAREYHVGGWPEPGKHLGAAAFWQVDQAGQVRTAKVMQYDPSTGRRAKEWDPKEECMKSVTTWAHSQAGGTPQGFKLDQCLFGEHLLDKCPDALVGIVESEKTALVARIWEPSVLWVSVGALTELKLAKLLPLAGRHVTLWPDLGKGFEQWSAKASDLAPLFASLKVADLLEQVATDAEREQGLDLADYILRRGTTEQATKAAPEPIPSPLAAFRIMMPGDVSRRRVVVRNGRAFASEVIRMDGGALSFAFGATSSARALVLSEMEALTVLDSWRGADLQAPSRCMLLPPPVSPR
jgi:hypothetical protein